VASGIQEFLATEDSETERLLGDCHLLWQTPASSAVEIPVGLGLNFLP
jgi:hypothetical protein